MKNIKQLLFLVLAVASLTLTSCSKVPAGNVGIKFHLLGSDKGVDYDVLSPGRYHIGINEELFLFPTFQQTKIWTADKREGSVNDDDFNFQSKKGLKLSASVSIEYHITPEAVPMIFEKYKTGLSEVTNKVLRNSLRNAFNMASSQLTSEQMYGEGKIAFMEKVDSIAKIEAVQRNIVIDDIFLIGNIVVPTSITSALNKKIEADQIAQQKESELRQAKADAQKRIANSTGVAEALLIEARAQAEANKLITSSLTPALISYERVLKWDGVLSKVSGGAGTLVDLRN